MDAKNRRHKKITVRYATPSREGIFIIVAQLRDDLGQWLVPTVTTSQPIQQIIESGRYVRDLAVALFKANYWYELWMMDVIDHE